MNQTQIYQQIKLLIFEPNIRKLFVLSIITLFIFICSKTLTSITSKKISDSNLRYRLRKLISFGAMVFFLLSASFIFSNKLSNLTMAIGFAGAGLAFALQELIASVAGWLAISFAHFFKVGDRVQLGGIQGDVIDIGVLRTTIMETGAWVKGDLYNGRIVRVSNSFVFKDPVYNYTSEFPFLWDEIEIPIRHGSSIPKTKKLIQQVAVNVIGNYEDEAKKHWSTLVNKFMIENARIEHIVTLTADENRLTFTLRYVVDYKMRRATKDKLFEKIIENIKLEEDIHLSYPTLEVSSGPKLHVKIDERK